MIATVVVPNFVIIGAVKSESTSLVPFTNLTLTVNETHGLDELLKSNIFTSFDELEAKDTVSCLMY